MAIHSDSYMHEADRTALQALKAIPGFAALMKGFMKVWGEQQFYIQNMATNLRIGENQMKKYYDMLPPICEKLGIEVPELYLKLDVNPNAYTSGDTRPFIVITTGLLDTMPEELIPTVLAHECGHIACHHVLYHMMGRMILSGASGFLGLNDLISFPVQAAFYAWMRKSELSADRAAAICDGTTEKMIEVCMRFAGFRGESVSPESREAFMQQAVNYREMVNTSKWNKTLEFMMYSHADHPLNAVRAYECGQWQLSREYACILANEQGVLTGTGPVGICMQESSAQFLQYSYEDACTRLHAMGFDRIQLERSTQGSILQRPGQVTGIRINGQSSFRRGEWFEPGAEVCVSYYQPLTEMEQRQAHPGQVRVPNSARGYLGRNYLQVMDELKQAGFHDFSVADRMEMKKSLLRPDKSVVHISIDGVSQFEKGAWFREDANVQIIYCNYTLISF